MFPVAQAPGFDGAIASVGSSGSKTLDLQAKMREIFRLIDVDGDGSVSKLELVAAMQTLR